ncbi:hypothetical protein HA466_0211690 [Hirschfeldia incana]|nr:hypothetical protein HA466_0211690 [Hirschfeldia incana]
MFIRHCSFVVALRFHRRGQCASKPICVWGNLASLVKFLIIIDGFTEIITEASLILTSLIYASCEKSIVTVQFPMDSPGHSTPFSSLPSCSPELRATLPPTSSMRNVSSSNTKWRCISISITVLPSYVPVRLGPEDAMDVISMIFQGADWILMSQYNVTKSQVSGAAVILGLTHSNFVSSLLSFYLRGFSTSSLYVLMYVIVRVWLNSFLGCSSNV